MKKFETNNAEETKSLASKLAREHRGNIIALTGELGSGKTTFVQGFAKGLGIKDSIVSPTFVLIKQHQIPSSKKTLYHIDLYRLDNMGDLKELGLQEILQNPNNVVLIEWAEKIKNLIPENAVWISLKMLDDKTREISIRS